MTAPPVPSWLDFVPPRDRYLADTDPAYLEYLRGTARGRTAELRATIACIGLALRVSLDIGGPLGLLLFKLDGSYGRRVRESVARNPSWRQVFSRRREEP